MHLGETCETVCFSNIFQLAHTFRLLAASSHVFQATGLNKLCNPELEWRLRKSPSITNHSTVHLNPRKELTCTCQENCKWCRHHSWWNSGYHVGGHQYWGREDTPDPGSVQWSKTWKFKVPESQPFLWNTFCETPQSLQTPFFFGTWVMAESFFKMCL